MGKTTEIAWTDSTFNPWLGCSKVSAGCANCYAETLMDKRMGRVQWGVGGTRVRTSEAYWRQPFKWNREAKDAGVRRRVFCASLADVFEDRPELEPWRLDLFKLIEKTPNLDWLLLTKRPENVMRMIELAQDQAKAVPDAAVWLLRMPHVWIGTSVEDQMAADRRIPELLRIPAIVRFLSMEPLLWPVDLHGSWAIGGQFCHKCDSFSWYSEDGVVCPRCQQTTMTTHAKIDWVIVGGESGHNARPMHPEWVRSIRDQCQAAGVPFFMKQWGEWWPHEQGQWISGPSIDPDVPDADFYRIGKRAAGRLLDGKEWNEFPADYRIGTLNP